MSPPSLLFSPAKRLCQTILVGAAIGALAPAEVHAGQISIGNVVFLDANYDGLFDAGEGVAGVEVRLFVDGQSVDETPVAVQDTTAGGKYLFTNLDPGSYFVHVPASEFQAGGPLAFKLGIWGASGADSDDDAGEDGFDEPEPWTSGVSSVSVEVANNAGPLNAPGIETGVDATEDDASDANGYLTLDLGFYRPVAVGNLVFADMNGNGHADAGEGIPGVRVQLFTDGSDPDADFPVNEAVTDALGHFLHSGLTPGQYFMHIPASDFQPGRMLQHAAPMATAGTAEDDDQSEDTLPAATPSVTGVSTSTFSLAAGTMPYASSFETGDDAGSDADTDTDVDLTRDMGFTFPAGWAGVGNLVYRDLDLDYSADLDEGVDGVVVELFDANTNPLSGSPLGSTVTTEGGRYFFSGELNGSYKIHIPPSQFAPGAPLAGLVSSFGTRAAGSDDNNGETGLDSFDPAVMGITSEEFVLAAGSAPTAATGEAGTDAWKDNFADASVNLTRDMGFIAVPPRNAGVGNLVYFDSNLNDQADPGEGLDGVVVRLFREGAPVTGEPMQQQVTSGGGFYRFTDVEPGRYFVHLPASNFTEGNTLYLRESREGVSGDTGIDDATDENGIDSAAPATSGISSVVFTLVPGSEPTAASTENGLGASVDNAADSDEDLTIDFAFVSDCPAFTITPAVLPNAEVNQFYTVTLSAAGGSEPYTWGATGLPTGVTINSASGVISGTPIAAAIYNPGIYAVDSSGCRTDVVRTLTVTPEQPKVGVGNVVFLDNNLNRKFDQGEGIAGVVVRAFNEGDDPLTATPAKSTVTTAGGLFWITGLNPGSYFLHIPPSEFQPGDTLFNKVSVPNYGLDDQRDDNLDENGVDAPLPSVSGISSVVVDLQIGEEPVDSGAETGTGRTDDNEEDSDIDQTVDFGFIPAGSGNVGIGNLVYVDANHDGGFDSGEGRDGVTVQLFAAGANPAVDAPVASMVTINGGKYLFTERPPGSYFVHVPAAEFLAGGDLNGSLSLAGAGSTVEADDNVDENGVDAADPPSSGVSTATFSFQPYHAPVDSLTETGHDRASDNADDASIYLTLDLGFVVPCPTITVTTTEISSGTAGVGYSTALAASGGQSPYSWSVTSGALPPGLTLAPSGLLSGTPTLAGGYAFGVGVTDSQGCTGSASLTITIVPPGTVVSVGNLVFFDADADNGYDAGEGVDGVTVEIYKEGDTAGASSPVASLTTNGSGRYLAAGLNVGRYFAHVPAAMFAPGAPLAGRISIPGVGTTVDDTDDNGQDALDPATTGVSTAVFALDANAEPTDEDAEVGAGAADDNADDNNGDMTIDLGFRLNLPSSFAAWQSLHPLDGANAPGDNPDGDQNSNLLEYAFGSDPNDAVTSASTPGFRLHRDDASGVLDAKVVRPAGSMGDVLYRLEAHVGGAWTLLGIVPFTTANGDGFETAIFGNLEADPLLTGVTSGLVRMMVWLDANHDNVPEAQSPTAVWFWIRRAVASGRPQSFSLPMARPEVFSGAALSVSGSTVALAVAAGDIGARLGDGREYYLEITSGDAEGHRFEIDEAVSAPGSVTLLLADARSTSASVPGTVTGSECVVRAHATVRDAFPGGEFFAANSPTTADRCLFYNRATSSFTSYWLYANAGSPKWVRVGDGTLADAGGRVLDVCEGCFIHPRLLATSVIETGIVRTNDVICPLPAGTIFIGGFSHLPQSPAQRLMRLADGTFSGGASAPSSDRVRLWRGDTATTQGYQGYFLINSGAFQYWVREQDGTLASQNDTALFNPCRGAFYISLSPHPLWKIPATTLP